jgi:hypothetical protein
LRRAARLAKIHQQRAGAIMLAKLPDPWAQRRLHHDIEAPQVDARAFRQGWKVSTRLDGLLRDELITPGAWQAAVDFRATWERGFGIGLGASGELLGSRTSNAARCSDGKLDALAWLRDISRRIGVRRLWLIERCVLHDYPWLRTAEMLRVSDKTARSWTAVALLDLRKAVAKCPERHQLAEDEWE